jgi:hypothetical protein
MLKSIYFYILSENKSLKSSYMWILLYNFNLSLLNLNLNLFYNILSTMCVI